MLQQTSSAVPLRYDMPFDSGDQVAARALTPPALVHIWHVAQRWKWVMSGIVAVVLATGLVLTLLMTPKFTASARIEISREEKKVTNVEGLESGEAGRDLEFYQTQYSLLEAESVASRVAHALHLTSDPTFFAAHGVRPVAGGGTGRTATERQTIALLLRNVSIAPIRGSALVDVKYTSASPELSAKVANMWVTQFIAASMDRRFASTADARAFLEGRLAVLRQRLEASERALVNYAADKGIVALDRVRGENGSTEVQRTLTSADLEALNEALAKATADRVAAESQAGHAGADGSNSDSLSNVAIASLRQRRAEAAAEYARLMVQFEPGYPAARAIAEQVASLDTAIAREVARVSGGRTIAYREAIAREQGLRDRVDRLKQAMGQQQRDSIQYNIYQREADSNRELYQGLLQRYKEIGVASVGANNVSIVDTADVPQRPSSPNLPLNILLSLIAGLGLAVAGALILEQIDEGLRDPGDVARLLGVPLLGSVLEVEDHDILSALGDPKSPLTEAYLSIRSNIAFSTDHGVPRALMVTSTRPAEGKSTTALALAVMLGRTGANVVLIDADMRSPSMHGLLEVSNAEGLSNNLAGDNDWRRMLHATRYRGLSVLPAGPTPPSAGELLSSDRMAMLIGQLAESFDHVVVDAPPILGLADAPLLSRAVEGCVFVVEAEGVAVRGVRASLGRLRAVRAHVFGVVLTKLKNKQASYGYGYGYGADYGGNTAGGRDR
ncbi:GumC family protein [Sphingomonas sp.]|uniref:GumC family protein n=1 Tax=Sphingomonas sp. TaxID=28214 RepID=UPI003CC64020